MVHMFALGARTAFRLALALVASLVATACGGKSPSPSAPAPVPGATQVTGRERLAWYQPGDGTQVSFRAYVDGVAVALTATRCVVAATESDCSAPLPPMSDGVHTVEVTAVSEAGGFESERSAPITLQKVTARAASMATALPDAAIDRRGADVSDVGLHIGFGLAADVVARDVRMPAQLGPLPDGRVLVAESGGRVRVLYPGDPDRMSVALEAAALLDPPPAGAVALTIDPDFGATHQVFVAYAYLDGADRLRARIVRLREVGDRLGEPAPIFDAALSADTSVDGVSERALAEGPRLAFGPDDLLYASLPAGLGFDGQPAASLPVPAVVRLTAEGHTPADGALTGVHTHPLAFGWHPSTRELLGLLPDGPAGALVGPLGGARGGPGADEGKAHFLAGRDGAEPRLRFDTLTAEGVRELAPLVAGAMRVLPAGVVRLGVPVDLEGLVPGLRGRLEDLVSRDGVVYAAITDEPTSRRRGVTTGVVVRLRQ